MKIYLAFTILLFSTQLYSQSDSSEEVYDLVDVIPKYPSGMGGFYTFISGQLTYPERPKLMGIQGQVFVQIVINKEGEVTQEKVMKGLHEELDAEALRVLKLSPNWLPGQVTENGPKCSVRMILPITFRIPTQKELEKRAKREAKEIRKKKKSTT